MPKCQQCGEDRAIGIVQPMNTHVGDTSPKTITLCADCWRDVEKKISKVLNSDAMGVLGGYELVPKGTLESLIFWSSTPPPSGPSKTERRSIIRAITFGHLMSIGLTALMLVMFWVMVKGE